MDIYTILALLFMPLATWRVSNMLADFDQHGPRNLLDRLRLWAGIKYDMMSRPYAESGSLAEGLTCVYCNSVWIAVILVVLLIVSPIVSFYVNLVLALSALAIIVEENYTRRSE